tara:strand:+ start:32 stop:448 length:417 start_codon:yes stop_codon:yes gene_type:complete
MINKNEIQNQFNKFPVDNVELEKIELALVDDVQKRVDSANALAKTINSYIKKMDSLYKTIEKRWDKQFDAQDKLQGAANKWEKIESNTKKILEKAENAANALGVKPLDVKGYKELYDQMYTGQEIEEEAQTLSRKTVF